MKLAPLFGLASKEFNKQVVKSYKGFAALPPLKAVLSQVGGTYKHFMGVLAVFHLVVAVVLLFFPTSPNASRVAGFYVMLLMVGAEYCTRSTGAVPPFTPPENAWLVAHFCTTVHIFLFFCGLYCCFPRRSGSVGSGKAVPSSHCGAPTPAEPKAVAPAAVPAVLPATAAPKVTKASEAVGSRKRDATPPPQEREGAERRRSGGAAERGAVALGK